MTADVGLIGLAVMGENLVLNLLDQGYKVSVYNRTISKVDEFLERANRGNDLLGCQSINELVNSLKIPRKIILMVKSGTPVDQFIEMIMPYLDSGDIIIDGGNSNFQDSIRRSKFLHKNGFYFIGAGISGGEVGARYGPSIMPGGSKEAWNSVKEILQSIAAKLDDGTACCHWIGENGAGHYVKMVHNGIEYGDMQLISEAYHILYLGLKLNHDEISNIFEKWNKGFLNSYLIEITANILKFKDKRDNKPLVTKILDKAGQKGTGKWTVNNALELGSPLTTISAAVFQRFLSSFKEERINAASEFGTNQIPQIPVEEEHLIINELELALYASKIISYSQGFSLMRDASKNYNWELDLGKIALIWRAGCIIRSIFLDKIMEAFDNNPNLNTLLLDSFFKNEIKKCQNAWRQTIKRSINWGISIPGFSASLAYFDGFRSEILPANLIQAQRDYFGAHGYQRTDKTAHRIYHTQWYKMEDKK